MRKLSAIVAALLLGACALAAELPDSLYVGVRDGHVQGIALDRAKGCMYFSFTSSFIKTDLSGNIIGTINRIQGHLGAMTLGPDGRVYASLECKDDEIGKGIADRLGIENLSHDQAVFYVAIIDVDRIDRPGMDPEKDGVMTTVCIREAVKDYAGSTYGCTGIDGITFAPAIGSRCKKLFLYVAYGIRGDNSRTDNDNQVILCYDIKDWKRKYETPVVFGTVPTNGPEKPLHKYFIHTGNTTWGVQNMAYDAATGRIFLAVYKGKKPQYPNYPLFCFDVDQKPVKACPKGLSVKQEMLRLSSDGLLDESTGVRGWNFKWGSTGLCPLGDGLWYISENHKDKATGIQSCTARLYRWTGEGSKPFVPRQHETTDH
ncbi:MAG: hypothetical protein J5640_07075 [Bacteroidales bacterium]|nr:hypothetical protein [Bacteroidales bacterium]